MSDAIKILKWPLRVQKTQCIIKFGTTFRVVLLQCVFRMCYVYKKLIEIMQILWGHN
jgi:hypothetical protein